MGVPIIRTIIFGVYIGVPPILGNYQMFRVGQRLGFKFGLGKVKGSVLTRFFHRGWGLCLQEAMSEP